MNWREDAFHEAWDRGDSEFYDREPETLFCDGAQWQREQLRKPLAIEKASADKSLTGLAEDSGCAQESIIETVLNALLGESE